jgi:hypothetical protein
MASVWLRDRREHDPEDRSHAKNIFEASRVIPIFRNFQAALAW